MRKVFTISCALFWRPLPRWAICRDILWKLKSNLTYLKPTWPVQFQIDRWSRDRRAVRTLGILLSMIELQSGFISLYSYWSDFSRVPIGWAIWQSFLRNQVKRGATNSSRVSLLNLQDQNQESNQPTNQMKPRSSQSDTNMSKMQNLEGAHLALSASRSHIEHQENILAALENRVSSLFNDSGKFSTRFLFG